MTYGDHSCSLAQWEELPLTLSEENMELRRISGLKKSDKKKCGE
jgi:hypothetical protein